MQPMNGMSRRTVLAAGLALAAVPVRTLAAQSAARIHTVTGPIAPERLGTTLIHEHVLVDFIGAPQVTSARYDRDAAFEKVLPYLREVRTSGCNTLAECTPAYLARDVRLLQRLSKASGLTILTNTGLYGAAQDRFVPGYAYLESPQQLAARWIRESEEGIDGTDIRPAFMKIGVDEGPLSAIDARLVQAAALTHLKTRLRVHSHTGNGVAAFEQLDLLQRAGVPASAFVWVHAQSEKDGEAHVQAAKRGAWVEFDGVSDSTIERHVQLVTAMKARGLLGRVLVSQDAGWYRVGEPDGGQFRPFGTLFTRFVPALEAAGVTKAEIRRLLVDNPREVLTAP